MTDKPPFIFAPETIAALRDADSVEGNLARNFLVVNGQINDAMITLAQVSGVSPGRFGQIYVSMKMAGCVWSALSGAAADHMTFDPVAFGAFATRVAREMQAEFEAVAANASLMQQPAQGRA